LLLRRFFDTFLGFQTGARFDIGRREAWCRRKNYIVKCMHEKKFGRAELNFGPGRWASVLMCCQDVADHRMQPETLGK